MKGLITGATRGIGWAIAQAVLHRTSELTIIARDEGRLDETLARLSKSAPQCKVETIAVDLADLASLRGELTSWGASGGGVRPLDYVVLNAGTYTEGLLGEIEIESYLHDLDVNLNSHLVAIQTLLPNLRAGDRRRVVLVGSTAAYEPYPAVPTYGVAKYGLRGLAANLRVELARDRIGVTFVSPGGTLTDMWEGEEVPVGRLLEPSDVGALVDAILGLSEQAVVEELTVLPMEGDMHD